MRLGYSRFWLLKSSLEVYIGKNRQLLSSLNIRWWRRQIGFVGQEPILFNTTVQNNIMPLEVSLLRGLESLEGA